MRDLTGELGYEARVLMLGCGNSGLSEVVRVVPAVQTLS
jgi:hypothetical protein